MSTNEGSTFAATNLSSAMNQHLSVQSVKISVNSHAHAHAHEFHQSSSIAEDDTWFEGDAQILQKEGQRPSFTPPLNLESSQNAERTPPVPPHLVPEIQTSNDPGSSFGSGTTSSITRSSNQNRPLLYSAIGSLENFTSASLQSFNKRLAVPSSVSARPKHSQSRLIPPGTKGYEQSSSLQSAQTTRSSKASEGTESLRAVSSGGDSKPIPTGVQKQESAQEAMGRQKQNGVLRHKGSSSRDSRDTKSQQAQAKNGSKKVSIDRDSLRKKKPVEMFRPSCDAYTPRIEKKRFQFKRAEQRTPVQQMSSPMGTLSRPNFRDALRRVAMIVHQHIVKIEQRFEAHGIQHGDKGLFKSSMRETFSEENYCTPTYKCTMVRIPMARPGMIYGLRKIKVKQTIPSEEEIYEFGHQLFKSVQLSSECSIVCLIYVERLMEVAKVPLLSDTWRPIFMCGLLLASKVWQDLSSWNIEFASVYPQYSLDAINRLELNFLRNVKWDLYISSTLYAKYYFALRSLVEKVDFRQRYNRMVGRVDSVAQSEALKISRRTEQFKEEALLQLSRSM